MRYLFILFILIAFWSCSSKEQYTDTINDKRTLYKDNIKCKLKNRKVVNAVELDSAIQ